MFSCDYCDTVTGPCVQPVRFVTERRPKTYGAREFYVRGAGGEVTRRTDPGGAGWEIAREAVVCPPCGLKAKFNGEAGK